MEVTNMKERQPVGFDFTITLPQGTGTSSGTDPAPIVPTDKILVIEFLTIRANLPTGQIPHVIIQTSAFKLGAPQGTTIQNNHRIAFTSGPLKGTALTDEYFATHQVKMYALGGDDIGINFSRNSTSGQAFAVVGFSGYLVDSL
jgi:hypothetical protein